MRLSVERAGRTGSPGNHADMKLSSPAHRSTLKHGALMHGALKHGALKHGTLKHGTLNWLAG